MARVEKETKTDKADGTMIDVPVPGASPLQQGGG